MKEFVAGAAIALGSFALGFWLKTRHCRRVDDGQDDDYDDLECLADMLSESTRELAVAVAANTPDHSTAREMVKIMANPALGNLATAVNNADTVIKSATTLVNGISDRIKTAVQDAIANGATAEELAPVTDLATGLNADSAALAAAVEANTPAQPPQPMTGSGQRTSGS